MMILFHESDELVKGELILLSFCNPLITKKNSNKKNKFWNYQI